MFSRGLPYPGQKPPKCPFLDPGGDLLINVFSGGFLSFGSRTIKPPFFEIGHFGPFSGFFGILALFWSFLALFRILDIFAKFPGFRQIRVFDPFLTFFWSFSVFFYKSAPYQIFILITIDDRNNHSSFTLNPTYTSYLRQFLLI